MPVQTKKTWDYAAFHNDMDKLIEWLKELECTKHTASHEICPKTGKPHIQGQITFRRAYSWAAIQKIFNPIYITETLCAQDSNYCRKWDSVRVINVDNRKQGHRKDIIEAREILRTTNSMSEVVEHTTSYQAVRMAEIWLKYKEPPRPIIKPEVHWRWGKTGVGKTRHIYELHEPEEIFRPLSYKWWDGYDGHKIVLLDELRGDWCKFGQLLILLDRYPYRVETKGGSRQTQATTWYITSSKLPEDLYSRDHFDAEERVDQLLRRITSITEILPSGYEEDTPDEVDG